METPEPNHEPRTAAETAEAFVRGMPDTPSEADARRFRTLIRSTGNELVLGAPGKRHKLQINLNVEGCERYGPDGAIDFPATIRAVLDDEQRIQDSWAEKKA